MAAAACSAAAAPKEDLSLNTRSSMKASHLGGYYFELHRFPRRETRRFKRSRRIVADIPLLVHQGLSPITGWSTMKFLPGRRSSAMRVLSIRLIVSLIVGITLVSL